MAMTPSTPTHRRTDDLDAYVDKFLELQSRVPDLTGAESRFALVNGILPAVQVHVLGQHHCDTLAEALPELRVYSHARRGAHPTRVDFATSYDFGTSLGGSSLAQPVDHDTHVAARSPSPHHHVT